MSRPVTDDRMRSLWRQRCQARRAIEACRKVIQDQTLHERIEMRRHEAVVFWTKRDLERGLREKRRGGTFRVDGTVTLVLDQCGELVPVWDWLWTHHDANWQEHATAIMEGVERREAVAC